MDLSFIGDQLGNFNTFAGAIEDIFKGFASAVDTIIDLSKEGGADKAADDTKNAFDAFDALSSGSSDSKGSSDEQ